MKSGKKPQALLWDIDGTLIHTQGAGKKALSLALEKCCGAKDDLRSLNLAGAMDQAVVSILCAQFRGLQGPDFIEAYLQGLPSTLREFPGKILPGVRETLEWAKAEKIPCGLVTGNLKQGAETKLRHFGLSSYFHFGAYGDDAQTRNALGPVALDRIRQTLGVWADTRLIWLIGDTPKDVECAKASGFRSLAVATGFATQDDLARSEPERLVENLSDLPSITALLCSPPYNRVMQ